MRIFTLACVFTAAVLCVSAAAAATVRVESEKYVVDGHVRDIIEDVLTEIDDLERYVMTFTVNSLMTCDLMKMQESFSEMLACDVCTDMRAIYKSEESEFVFDELRHFYEAKVTGQEWPYTIQKDVIARFAVLDYMASHYGMCGDDDSMSDGERNVDFLSETNDTVMTLLRFKALAYEMKTSKFAVVMGYDTSDE